MVSRVTGADETSATRRTARRRWKDPRLLLGLVLMLGCAVGGSAYASSRDDTVGYWGLVADVVEGQPFAIDQLEVRQARISGDASYMRADAPLPARADELEWAAATAAGELATARSLRTRGSAGHTELPLHVPTGNFSSQLAAGDNVEVWVTPEGASQARQLWSGVRVVEVGDASESVAGVAVTVVVALAEGQVDSRRLGALVSGPVLLVRIP